MAIREKSFRIGCGRYLQDAGILSSIGNVVRRLRAAMVKLFSEGVSLCR